MTENIQIYNKGYIALTSVIIISLLLLALTVALSAANYFGRTNIMEYELKVASSNLAEACLNYAKAKLMADPLNYSGNELSVPVAGDTCSVISVLPTGNNWPKTLKTQGIYPKNQPEESYTNLSVVLNSDFSLDSWQETSN